MLSAENQIVDLKATADEAFKTKDWETAATQYSAAITMLRALMNDPILSDCGTNHPQNVAVKLPHLFVLYNNRSASYLNDRLAQLAVDDAATSLSLDATSQNARAHQRMGYAYRTLGQLHKASISFDAYLKYFPGDAEVRQIKTRVDFFHSHKEVGLKESCQVVAATTSVKQNEADPFGSGDQSPVKGLPQSEMPPRGLGFKLRKVWAQEHDFNPASAEISTHSDFMYHCYMGNPKKVQFLIDRCKESNAGLGSDAEAEAVRQLVNRRESILRSSPLIAAVAGTRINRPESCGPPSGNLEVFKILLLNGADPNAKDIAGFSVVHNATTVVASPITLQILPILYERGADFNCVNRLLDGPLCEPITSNLLDSVRGLLQFGCDPAKLNAIGQSAITRAVINPTMAKLMQSCHGFRCLLKGTKVLLRPKVQVKVPGSSDPRVKVVEVDCGVVDGWSRVGWYRVGVKVDAVAEEGGGCKPLVYVDVMVDHLQAEARSDGACSQCGQANATLQCSVCKAPKYCSRVCQKAHWKEGHKEQCTSAASEPYWTVHSPKVGVKQMDLHGGKGTPNLITGCSPKLVDLGKKALKLRGQTMLELIVKVQLPLEASAGPHHEHRIRVCNEEGNINWVVNPHSSGGSDANTFRQMVTSIKATGSMKQYYRADLLQGDELRIYQHILEPKTW